MTRPERPSPVYVVTMPMGLDGVAREELSEKIGDHDLLERGSHELAFRYSGPPTELLSLRSVTDAWLVVRRVQEIGARYQDLRGLQVQLARTRLQAPLEALRRAGVRLKPRMTFTTSCSVRGRRAYRRLDALQAVEKAIAQASAGKLRPVRLASDLRFWLHLEGEEARLCLALSPKPLGLRDRPASLPASLPGPVAYAMAALTRPRDDDLFLDPMCGSGSIALERAEGWRYRLLLVGDRDPEALWATRANFGPRHRPREFLHWDATALPLAAESVDAMSCNPPHGVQLRPEAGLEALYHGVLAEAARILKPHAHLTFLTPRRELADDVLERLGAFRIERCFVIDLLGRRPYLYVLRRI